MCQGISTVIQVKLHPHIQAKVKSYIRQGGDAKVVNDYRTLVDVLWVHLHHVIIDRNQIMKPFLNQLGQ